MSATERRTAWKSRIVDSGEEKPDQLMANPRNWRIHPKAQQDALAGVLSEVGWVQQVIVNRRTGHLIDGHLRVALAMREDAETIPVLYVDLDEAEEALALATIDPLAAMAVTDAGKLEELLGDVATGEAAVQEMLAGLAIQEGITPPDDFDPIGAVPSDDAYQEQYGVIVLCSSEGEQREAYEALRGEGYDCRVVTT